MPPPTTADAHDPAHTPTELGDELALRAGLDPAWDTVLAAWIAGRDLFPQPFVNRTPARRCAPAVEG